ncbi:uncharacterized protein LOC125914354 [Panthera uncia]|uniref:uncharacterized protein LOC125914354 n=1 Tax=Panthera uncia TaxID=29064 RepID=UPI0020FFC7EA|nr:uncharacterized protein LOC125914354 [Panthera uncia]
MALGRAGLYKLGKFYLVIEELSQLFRSLVPIQLWYKYIMGDDSSNSYFLGGVLIVLYSLCKSFDICGRVGGVRKALKLLCTSQNYGVRATGQQCTEAGDICAICQAEFREPLVLMCQLDMQRASPVPFLRCYYGSRRLSTSFSKRQLRPFKLWAPPQENGNQLSPRTQGFHQPAEIKICISGRDFFVRVLPVSTTPFRQRWLLPLGFDLPRMGPPGAGQRASRSTHLSSPAPGLRRPTRHLSPALPAHTLRTPAAPLALSPPTLRLPPLSAGAAPASQGVGARRDSARAERSASVGSWHPGQLAFSASTFTFQP